MKRILSHIILPLTMALTAAGTASCTFDDSPDCAPEQKEAILSVRLGPVDGSTRASASSSTPECERIKNIRLLVVDNEGKLEINRNFLITDPNSEYTFVIFGVSTKGDKKIFAIANDDASGLKDSKGNMISDWEKGMEGVENIIKDFSFQPEYSGSKPIPHFGEEMIVGDLDPEKPTEVDINLVRVATKFDVKIINKRGENVKVSKFDIHGMADKTFLVPRFNRTGEPASGMTANKNAGIIRKTKGKDRFLEFVTSKIPADGAKEIHWTEWMKKAVEESQKNPTDKSLADLRGWIMEYDIPEGAPLSSKPWIPTGADITVEAGKSQSLTTHYYPESKQLLKSLTTAEIGNWGEWKPLHADADGLEQGYTYDITFESLDKDGKTVETKEFKNLIFKNLRSLFRNTHVTLEITITKSGTVIWEVYTRPWYPRVQPEIIM